MMFTGVGLLRLVSCSSPTTGNTPEGGLSQEDLRSRKFQAIPNKAFQLLLLEMEKDGLIRVSPRAVALQAFDCKPGHEQLKQIDKILGILRKLPFCRLPGLNSAGTRELVRLTGRNFFSTC